MIQESHVVIQEQVEMGLIEEFPSMIEIKLFNRGERTYRGVVR